MRGWMVALGVASGCRAGVAPGGVYRFHDADTAAMLQVEAGGYTLHKQTRVGAFFVLDTMQPRGETEGHTGWFWSLFELRYRQTLVQWPSSQLFLAAGLGVGGGNRDGTALATHAEIGFELGTSPVTVDVSLRQCLMRVPNGDRPMDIAAMLFAISVGASTRK